MVGPNEPGANRGDTDEKLCRSRRRAKLVKDAPPKAISDLLKETELEVVSQGEKGNACVIDHLTDLTVRAVDQI